MMPDIGPSTAPKIDTKMVIAWEIETNSHGQTSTERIDAIKPPIRKLMRRGATGRPDLQPGLSMALGAEIRARYGCLMHLPSVTAEHRT
jgi:hypothetical protein